MRTTKDFLWILVLKSGKLNGWPRSLRYAKDNDSFLTIGLREEHVPIFPAIADGSCVRICGPKHRPQPLSIKLSSEEAANSINLHRSWVGSTMERSKDSCVHINVNQSPTAVGLAVNTEKAPCKLSAQNNSINQRTGDSYNTVPASHSPQVGKLLKHLWFVGGVENVLTNSDTTTSACLARSVRPSVTRVDCIKTAEHSISPKLFHYLIGQLF